jgi:hypothetical protein
MRRPDGILVLGTTFGRVPVSEWEREVDSAKQIVIETATMF